MDKTFLDNFEITANLLFDECLATLHWEPDYIVSQVLDRRVSFQRTLENHYRTDGCQSPEAVTARNHYHWLRQLDPARVKKF